MILEYSGKTKVVLARVHIYAKLMIFFNPRCFFAYFITHKCGKRAFISRLPYFYKIVLRNKSVRNKSD